MKTFRFVTTGGEELNINPQHVAYIRRCTRIKEHQSYNSAFTNVENETTYIVIVGGIEFETEIDFNVIRDRLNDALGSA